MRPTYTQLRIIHFLWKLREPLRCEGEVWSFYHKPTIAINRDSLEDMIEIGWLERCYHYDAPLDDYKLSLDGLQAAQAFEGDYLAMIESKINENVK